MPEQKFAPSMVGLAEKHESCVKLARMEKTRQWWTYLTFQEISVPMMLLN